MTPSELRRLFPAFEKYTWLNAAASSPTAVPVNEAMQRFLADTVETGDLHYPAWARFKEETRARLARYLGATAGEIAFVQSTSFGFHVIGQMLKARGITEVLTLEAEFPSTTIPFLYDGLTLRAARMRPDGTCTVGDLEAALTAKTGAIAVSAVQFASGFRIDLEAVSQLCKSRGLAFIINAAQGIGHMPLDVAKLGADFLAATSHKWLMAGYGTGMLFIGRKWLDAVRLPFAGWLSLPLEDQFDTWAHATRVDDEKGFTATGTRTRTGAAAREVGGAAWVGLYALNAALELHEAVGTANTLQHNIGLQMKLRQQLRARGFTPNTPDDPKVISGICVVPVKGAPIDTVRALIAQKQVCTTARGGGIRVATHHYNDESDLERLIIAIDELGIEPA